MADRPQQASGKQGNDEGFRHVKSPLPCHADPFEQGKTAAAATDRQSDHAPGEEQKHDIHTAEGADKDPHIGQHQQKIPGAQRSGCGNDSR